MNGVQSTSNWLINDYGLLAENR